MFNLLPLPLTKEMKPVKMCGATKSTWICCCLGVGGM